MVNKYEFCESEWVMCHQIEQLNSAEASGNSFVMKR